MFIILSLYLLAMLSLVLFALLYESYLIIVNILLLPMYTNAQLILFSMNFMEKVDEMIEIGLKGMN
jgi:hypothetical protein